MLICCSVEGTLFEWWSEGSMQPRHTVRVAQSVVFQGKQMLMFYHIGTCPSEKYIKTILYLFIYLFVLFSFALKNTFKYRHRNNIHICLAFVFQCKTNSSSSSSTLFTLLSFLYVKPPPLTETDALRHILSFDSVRCEGSLLV